MISLFSYLNSYADCSNDNFCLGLTASVCWQLHLAKHKENS